MKVSLMTIGYDAITLYSGSGVTAAARWMLEAKEATSDSITGRMESSSSSSDDGGGIMFSDRGVDAADVWWDWDCIVVRIEGSTGGCDAGDDGKDGDPFARRKNSSSCAVTRSNVGLGSTAGTGAKRFAKTPLRR